MLDTFGSGLEIHPKLIWYGNSNLECFHVSHSIQKKGHMFMALDPSVFVDGFPSRMNGLMSDLRNLEPVSFHIPIPHTGRFMPFYFAQIQIIQKGTML